MSILTPALIEVDRLTLLGERVNEEPTRVSVEGSSLTDEVAGQVIKINEALDRLGVGHASFLVDGRQIDSDVLPHTQQLLAKPWRWVIGKGNLVAKIKTDSEAKIFLFLNPVRFVRWFETVDPFVGSTRTDQPFNGPTTIRIHGLDRGVWGPSLRVLGLDEVDPPSIMPTALPTESSVHTNVSISSDRPIKLRPRDWEITGGDLTTPTGIATRRKSTTVMAACLAQQITQTGDELKLTLKGSKKVELSLMPAEDTQQDLLPTLTGALAWVYEERTETRLKLLVERLCVDLDGTVSFIAGLQLYLTDALQQARDSYAFVILERKDAYHKEMREFMKDMKGQADQYAAKVRDLVSALTRDVLGVLVLVGFSFISKFDVVRLQEMNKSAEFALLARTLAGYLLISCALLLYISYRDAKMGYSELSNWFKILQNYTSKSDFKDRVLAPLDARKSYLWKMMFGIGFVYLSLVIAVWNLPALVGAAMGWS
jgi:hypothetical protein